MANLDKIYPQGASDLLLHLGAHPSQTGKEDGLIKGASVSDETGAVSTESRSTQSSSTQPRSAKLRQFHKTPLGKTIKAVMPYVAVFIVAGLFYFIFIGGLSLSDMKSWIPNSNDAHAQQSPKIVAEQIPSSQMSAYDAWINSYFFDVTDTKILAPDYDISGNGLTNYQKFLLGLNPKKQDTMGLGMTDTRALINGIDPLTGGPLTSTQKTIIAQSVDLEGISNKLTLQSLDQTPKVAGASTGSNGDDRTSIINLNQSASGELDIPSLKIKVPLIWAPDPDSVEKDLLQGVVHYPGTPMPGQIGTSYISGHSSNYAWIKSPYNRIFESIDKLKMYDGFTISATDASGNKVVFHYAVRGTGIFTANDQKQFANIGKSTVALSTCWPIGTASKRYVVFGQLTSIDQ